MASLPDSKLPSHYWSQLKGPLQACLLQHDMPPSQAALALSSFLTDPHSVNILLDALWFFTSNPNAIQGTYLRDLIQALLDQQSQLQKEAISKNITTENLVSNNSKSPKKSPKTRAKKSSPVTNAEKTPDQDANDITTGETGNAVATTIKTTSTPTPNWLTEALIKERLETDALIAAGLVDAPRADKWKKAKVVINTRHYYTQKKFNLMREESEGFSKMMIYLTKVLEEAVGVGLEVNSDLSMGESAEMDTKADADAGVNTQQQLDVQKQQLPHHAQNSDGSAQTSHDPGFKKFYAIIGHFNLDPNRVLDLILNTVFVYVMHESQKRSTEDNSLFSTIDKLTCITPFSLHPNLKNLLSIYDPIAVAQMIGFQFSQMLQNLNTLRPAAPATADAAMPTPPQPKSAAFANLDTDLGGLCLSTVVLIRDKLVDERIVFEHVLDVGDSISQVYREYRQQLDNDIKSVGRVNLNEADESSQMADNSLTQISKEQLLLSKHRSEGPFHSKVIPALDIYFYLVCFGQWKVAESLHDKILATSPKLPIDVASDPLIAKALINLTQAILHQVFSANEPWIKSTELEKGQNRAKYLTGPQEMGMIPVLEDDTVLGTIHDSPINRLLDRLGGHCYRDPAFFTSLCCYISKIQEVERKMNLLKRVILPAYMMMPTNTNRGQEIWACLKNLSFEKRYYLYSSSKFENPDDYPLIPLKNAISSFELKKIMRRMSKETEKTHSRQFANLLHRGTLSCFDILLDQVRSYENVIPVLADAVKLVASFPMDMLVYSCLLHLADQKRDKLKRDGTNVAEWFSNTSTFVSLIFRKYYARVDMKGVLHFIYNRLRADDAVTIFLLRDIVSEVAGIDSSEDVRVDQMEAAAGGLLLQACSSSSYEEDLAKRKYVKWATAKLKQELMDSKLTLDMAVAVARQKEELIYNVDNREWPLKMIANLYDTCQDLLKQYASFLEASQKSNASNLDELKVLFGKHITRESCFLLYRHHFKYLDMFENTGKENKMSDGTESQNVPTFSPRYIEVAKSLEKNTKIWKAVTPELYFTFWTLSLSDVYVPEEQYINTIEKLKSQEKLSSYASELQREFDSQLSNQKNVIKMLELRKSHFFVASSSVDDVASQFLQNCILPRCVSSHEDAMFCARFVLQLQSMDTPYLYMTHFFIRLTSILGPFVFSCSENEALRFGRFFNQLLKFFEDVRSSEARYEVECGQKTCYSLNDGKPAVKHRKFLKWLLQQHNYIAKVFSRALSSEEYIEIRNTLSVLSEVVEVFPKTFETMYNMQTKVEMISKSDRQDLKLTAVSYLTRLKNNSDSHVKDSDFLHLREIPDPQRNSATLKKAEVANGQAKRIKDEETKIIARERTTTAQKSAPVEKAAPTEKLTAVAAPAPTAFAKMPSVEKSRNDITQEEKVVVGNEVNGKDDKPKTEKNTGRSKIKEKDDASKELVKDAAPKTHERVTDGPPKEDGENSSRSRKRARIQTQLEAGFDQGSTKQRRRDDGYDNKSRRSDGDAESYSQSNRLDRDVGPGGRGRSYDNPNYRRRGEPSARGYDSRDMPQRGDNRRDDMQPRGDNRRDDMQRGMNYSRPAERDQYRDDNRGGNRGRNQRPYGAPGSNVRSGTTKRR